MPGATSKKDLYLGKSMTDLNSYCTVKDLGPNVKLLIKSAEKTFQEAVKQDDCGDEERSYILYMKYFNVVQQAKKQSEYKKQKEYYDSLLGSKNQMKAIQRAESLSQSLKERYDLIEAESIAKKLSKLDAKTEIKNDENEKIEEKILDKEKGEKGSSNILSDRPTEKKKKESIGSILPTHLYDIMKDKEIEMLIMDVRTVIDYNQSHIDHINCINVPVDIVPPGTTCRYIEKDLPAESISLWSKRGSVDHIILLDWNSTLEMAKVGTTLNTLKDALFKYDSKFILKSEPLILEGGYSNWLLYYPMKTTNPHIDRPILTAKDPLALLDFDYPKFEDEEIKPKQSQPVLQKETPSPSNSEKNFEFPQFDRSTKPKPSGTIASKKTFNQLNEMTLNNIKNSPVTEKSVSSEILNQNTLYPSMSNLPSSSGSLKNTNIAQASRPHKSVDNKPLNTLKQQQTEEFKQRQKELDESELQKIENLEKIRKKQEKDVANLMRMKRNLQEELKNERLDQEERRRKYLEEEQLKLQEIEKKKEQDVLKAKLEELDKLRHERKLAEQKRIQDERETVDAAEKRERLRKEQIAAENAEKLKLENERQEQITKDQQAKIKSEKSKEAERQEQILRDRQNRIELEKRKEVERLALEKKKREDEQRLKEEQQRVENEQLAEERLKVQQAQIEADKSKAEKARIEADKARKLAEEKINRMQSQPSQPKVYPSPNLPVGWEKRLDRSTNRYFYIDHNKGETHWEPPQINRTPNKGNFTTKIKEEPTTPTSTGLKRSFSSPDIMKLMEQEERIQQPSINRSVKPAIRTEPKTYIKAPVKRRDLNPIYGNVGAALTGLRNLGNTCYMNSTIQCLNHTTPLVSYFVSDIFERDINRSSFLGMNGEVVDEFAVVVKALWSGQYRCITPKDLKSTIGKYNPMFAGYEQQDSQELLTFLLDGLHEGLNEVKHRPQIPDQNNDNLSDIRAAELAWENHKKLNLSVIVSLFQGQLKSTVKCLECGKESATFEAFMYLSLPIPDKSRCSLKDCIEKFLKPEMMTGSSRYKCTACKVPRDAVKRIQLFKLPPILLIGLNRFVSDGMWMQKKTTYVDFGINDITFNDCVIGPRPKSYNLYAVSNHYGTMEGGHYTAYCRNPSLRKWFKFDDHEVYEISLSDVKSSAGYLLFYTSMELPIPEFKPQLR
ncbi:ubiquitin carboxyl-terminal hydrolase 8 [Patella vulgata]|uniref:ubiquitin carboxyl-terminal hydrolase 8 n=1 Tax=Patella vulgata TaxID=6465 RepID=UPI00217F9F4F|nr:ubiquitin carboxyl-terminal hydrolase 8 [Patella vulgata]